VIKKLRAAAFERAKTKGGLASGTGAAGEDDREEPQKLWSTK
jgi:hypothetical protein